MTDLEFLKEIAGKLSPIAPTFIFDPRFDLSEQTKPFIVLHGAFRNEQSWRRVEMTVILVANENQNVSDLEALYQQVKQQLHQYSDFAKGIIFLEEDSKGEFESVEGTLMISATYRGVIKP